MATYQVCSPIERSAQGPPGLASFWFEIRISFINFNFFLSEAVREVPGTLVATTIGPRPLGSLAFLFSFPRGRGPARVFPPTICEFVVATPHYDSRCAFFRPPDFRPKLYPQDGVNWFGPLHIGILK